METREVHPSEAYASDIGIVYQAEFIPFSKSRKAVPSPSIKDLQLNWKVKLKRGRRKFECDYSAGIGHLPKDKFSFVQKFSYTQHEIEAIRFACENGHAPRGELFMLKGTPLPPPALSDVLHCLVLDYTVLDYANFEEWADDFGYDKDSRSAEAIYKECLDQALRLRAVLSDEEIKHLALLLEGY